MAVYSIRITNKVNEYVDKLETIFAPLFFAIIGAQVDLRGVNLNVLVLSAVIVAIAIITKTCRLWTSLTPISKRQEQVFEGEYWNDRQGRGWYYCGRSRYNIRCFNYKFCLSF
jgi:Kef-type K+ transport system membrane component KefB